MHMQGYLYIKECVFTCLRGRLGRASRGKHEVDRVKESRQRPGQVGPLKVRQALSKVAAPASLFERVGQRHRRVSGQRGTAGLAKSEKNLAIKYGSINELMNALCGILNGPSTSLKVF